jgi:excisionase family DNA binding protein
MTGGGDLLTIDQAARDLGRRRETVLHEINRGALRAVTVQPFGPVDERLRIREADLDRWLRDRGYARPAAVRERNRRVRRAKVKEMKAEVSAALHRERLRHAESRDPGSAPRSAPRSAHVPESRPRRRRAAAGEAGAGSTERLIARKRRVEAAVRRRSGQARNPEYWTTCELSLEDGTPFRWRYWPALDRREYLQSGATA